MGALQACVLLDIYFDKNIVFPDRVQSKIRKENNHESAGH
jgi:hypothetical protein